MEELPNSFRLIMRKAHVRFDEGHTKVDCLIRSLARTGANIEFEIAVVIPDHFSLYFDDRSPPVPCVVMWKIGTTLGVEFEFG